MPRWGQQPIERDQSSQGGLQRFRAGVADAEVDEVLRHEVLVAGTDKGQPVERREWGRVDILDSFSMSMNAMVAKEFRVLST